MADLNGFGSLLSQGDASPTSAASPTASQEPGAKRRKLRHYDLVPGQVLNPMGASGIESISLELLWSKISQGNKVAEAFSEFCFDTAERQGVALSRFASVVDAACQRLKNCVQLQAILKPEIYAAIVAEIDSLQPHLKLLDRGREGASGGGSIRGIAYLKPQGPISGGNPDSAADAVREWLQKVHSPLRSAFALFSSGGIFFVAQCHEKTARAWMHSMPDFDCAQRTMRAAASARASAGPPDLGSTELLGLSQEGGLLS